MIRILKSGEVERGELFARDIPQENVSGAVSAIIADVRENGDAALFRYCEKFDGAKLESLRVSEKEIQDAAARIEPEFMETLEAAAANIRQFHEKQVREGFSVTEREGVVIGQKITPIEKVGLYVPGGKAAYPSTVLMDAIPAKIAGCSELVMVTPPGKDGKIADAVLCAAKTAGVDAIFKIGGAQAVAALAYGTESVPAVDKIVGPGSAFASEAKRQVFGKVAIDMIAGPSEILVIADRKSDPAFVAADMLSQAEHDELASAVLVTDSEELALAVAAELDRQLETLERRDIAAASIENNGKIIIAGSIPEAIDIANEIAPEHVELCVDDPMELLPLVRNAGSVFLGRNCPEAVGDYFAGTNHTLPTSGAARFSNPLSVDDFIKKTQYIYYSDDAIKNAAPHVSRFARKEGLTAHARSIEIRAERTGAAGKDGE